MALPGVLSALRELILDELPIPEQQLERAEYYRQRFQSLSSEEREDLAKIEPRFFRIYTSTIFAGERSVLQRHFPLTFALLHAGWETVYCEKFDRLEFVKKLHRARPWKSNTTRGLTDNLVLFLSQDCPGLIELQPFLLDAVEMESLSLGCARVKERVEFQANNLSVEQMKALAVGELMELSIFTPRCVRSKLFDYDVLTLRGEYAEKGNSFSARAERRQVYALAARNRHARVRWLDVSEPVFRLVSTMEQYQRHSIEELAEAVAEHAQAELQTELTEEQLFATFAEQLFRLNQGGALIVTTEGLERQ